jgi:chromosomal replication initiation ATPase DnaA
MNACVLWKHLKAPAERQPQSRKVAIRSEIERVCKALSVSEREVLGGTRRHPICMARAIIAHNLREKGLTLEEIGRALNRNHGTIVNALHKYDDLVSAKDRGSRQIDWSVHRETLLQIRRIQLT